jgi:serine/threonine-protein kinase
MENITVSDPNELILHEGTQIIPISSVTEKIRKRLPTSSGTYVLSRPGTRNGSMIVDDQGVKLVKLLADGLLLTDALRRLAVESAMPPEVIAQEAYPLIKAMISKKYLKKRAQQETPAIKKELSPHFRRNDIFEGHTIVRLIQFLEDTEIYQIRLKQGGLAALKILRKGNKHVYEAFKRESLILQRLGLGVAPQLLEYHSSGDVTFLVTEWIHGMQSQLWAARVANLEPLERHSETLHMCKEIVRAYLQLHEQGVLHSDIYPKNVLICHDGKVRIIDFGYSFHPEVDAEIGKSRRNCNTYFKSPDLAQAEVSEERSPSPPASIASDIYSIGALLYHLVTGSTYINFALQHRAVHLQIIEAPMVPFAERGIHGFDELERIIAKMLAKRPSERYSSLQECISDLDQVSGSPAVLRAETRRLTLKDVPTLSSCANNNAPSPFQAPSASINFGGAGVAYALLRAAHALDDHSLIRAADVWACHANIWMEQGPEGSFCEKIGITPRAVGPYSALHRREGVTLVQALIAHSQLDTISLRRLCASFLTGIHRQEAPLEFILGKAGMLNTIQQLSYLVEENQPFIKVGKELVDDMLREIASFSEISQSPIRYLGFAHGWAGILYSLLAWGRRYETDIIPGLVPVLKQVASHRVDTRLGSFWSYRFDHPTQEGDMASWCNGTAGFILLWTEAYLATQDTQWLELAKDAARHCVTYFENINSVCCGLAGRAYALAILGSVSGEQKWVDAALRCLQRTALVVPEVSSYPHSLFKGVLGHELAKLEISKGEGIVFPTLASDMYGEPLPVGAFVPSDPPRESSR